MEWYARYIGGDRSLCDGGGESLQKRFVDSQESARLDHGTVKVLNEMDAGLPDARR